MFKMYVSNSHNYTHLILALGIVREPTVWGFNTSEYPGIHDIGLPIYSDSVRGAQEHSGGPPRGGLPRFQTRKVLRGGTSTHLIQALSVGPGMACAAYVAYVRTRGATVIDSGPHWHGPQGLWDTASSAGREAMTLTVYVCAKSATCSRYPVVRCPSPSTLDPGSGR